ncbi:efflux RND transporter periplasmic adaptor subunit [Effusibacillus dendaii]|uniref:Secretion protein HlyD n=1 Tax=Effusibacillus dendaii TaxID=2743772 RepID=A0A7I8DCA4_9BACL|nr:efflux RND transporter periplasmic adaptor subunit [Effusibacillus dendaii]BCJ87813.1 secretion protein HlyD [Effusibacillus dendaii]
MKKRCVRLAIAAVFAVATLTAGCSSSKPTAGRQTKAVPVNTMLVQTGSIGGSVTLTGQVASNVQTKVVSKQSGKIAKVFVNIGDKVTAGQTLAQLDTSDLEVQLNQQQAAVQVAQAQYEKAKTDAVNSSSQASSALTQAQVSLNDAQTNYERTKNLYDSGAVSKQQLDTAELNLETAKAKLDAAQQQYQASQVNGDPLQQGSVKVAAAQLEQARANLAVVQNQYNEATITSPVTGTVVSKDADMGTFVGTQTSVVTVAQVDPVKVNLNIPETIIANVTPGLPVTISVQSLGNETIKATLSRVSSVVDQNVKAYPAEVVIPNPEGKLKSGMVAQVTIEGMQTHQGIQIPSGSLVQTADGAKVFVVQNNVAHQVLLKLGVIGSTKVEVLDGLKPGDVLVVGGQELLGEGTPVQVQNGPGADPNKAANQGQSSANGQNGEADKGQGNAKRNGSNNGNSNHGSTGNGNGSGGKQ